MENSETHIHFMNMAYQEALKAFDEGEVPVGAVIAKDGKVAGRGYNRIESLKDATAHAEILAIGAASASIGTWRLDGCVLYVTLEPCLMCIGAILQSRIDTVVFGTLDPRLGAVVTSDYKSLASMAYGRFPAIEHGILADKCSDVLKSFFKKLRAGS
jgi:tRNA(adenine34) deaminase